MRMRMRMGEMGEEGGKNKSDEEAEQKHTGTYDG